MIAQLKKHYNQFADSTMYNFNYTSIPTCKIEITVYCLNIEKNKWELLKISFFELIKFRFVQPENYSNDVFMHALINEKDDILIFDFFPKWLDSDNLEENSDSRFSIHCKRMEYEVVG